jgi:hypothetical protein
MIYLVHSMNVEIVIIAACIKGYDAYRYLLDDMGTLAVKL